MSKTTKLYNRINELYDSLWEGIINVPEILDFKFNNKALGYIMVGNANILYTLDEHININNVLIRLSKYKEKIPYFTLCIYKTNESDLSKAHPIPVNDFGAYYDRILSMHIFNDYTKIIYSDGLKAEDINKYIFKLEKMMYNYLQEHYCNEIAQINIREEVDKLEDLS